MRARLAARFALCMLTVGAAMGPVQEEQSPAEAFRAATRLARDGDMQADWNKLLDARTRLEGLAHSRDLAAAVHYELGYLEWRLSALVYLSVGPQGVRTHWRRAIARLEHAVALRPDSADAHALIALCSGALLGIDPGLADELRPRAEAAWKAALDPSRVTPRARVLRAMAMFNAPPAHGGSQSAGLELWLEAIAQLEKEQPTDPLSPEWGLAEAWGWLGGAYLMQEDRTKAIRAFQRALELRTDFWWVSRVAMPQAMRPASTTPEPQVASNAVDHFTRMSLGSDFARWLANAWSTVAGIVRLLLDA